MTTQSLDKKQEIILVKRKTGVTLAMFESAAKFNSLGTATMDELEEILKIVEADDSIKAVVGISGKADNFIIGADLHEIKKARSEEELLRLSSRGQYLLNKIATLGKPFVAAINGACLGGGLELALAAHARVATKNDATILGLPETRLGLIPGLGGTQRLPRLIGLKGALDLILSAAPISSEKAKEIGLIDELVETDHLIEEAEKKALALLDSPEWRQSIEKEREACSESGIRAGKFCLADLTPEKAEKLLAISERAVKLRTKGHYPAQTEVLRVIRTGLNKGLVEGLKAESETFANLAFGDISANLISLYFNTDLAKGSSQALVNKFPGSVVKVVGVIGAGTMGTSLAQTAAARGVKAILKTDPAKVETVRETMTQLAQKEAHHKKDDQEYAGRLESILEKIQVTGSFDDLAEADLIVECVIEDHETKSATIAALSGKISDHCVIASNTSALSITELSKAHTKPENFLGVHFFHPIDRMPLVELIAHPGTSKAALAKASDLVLKLDKTPMVVKDKPGFLINRLLTVYLFELARLAEEGTPINWIEDTMLEFGMPMGPLQIMDEIGIDVAFTVAKNLEDGLGSRMRSPEIFKRVCAIGLQGKRSNVGFYLWEANEKKLGINPDMLEKTGATISSDKCDENEKGRITDRMLLSMLDEAARCLEERIVARPREIDLALILGVGFPAFRGGLLKYADHRGLPKLVERLEQIYAFTTAKGSSGERTVSTLLKKYASEGRGFYSLAGNKEE